MMRRSAALALLAAIATACGGGAGSGATEWQSTPHPLAAIPPSTRFVADTTIDPKGTALSATACRTRLVDPASGTRLTLVRSQGADERRAAEAAGVSTSAHPQGDFAVAPPTAWGLGAGDLLRVDCATGEALGTVKR